MQASFLRNDNSIWRNSIKKMLTKESTKKKKKNRYEKKISINLYCFWFFEPSFNIWLIFFSSNIMLFNFITDVTQSNNFRYTTSEL